jgi:hypothetical protein
MEKKGERIELGRYALFMMDFKTRIKLQESSIFIINMSEYNVKGIGIGPFTLTIRTFSSLIF